MRSILRELMVTCEKVIHLQMYASGIPQLIHHMERHVCLSTLRAPLTSRLFSGIMALHGVHWDQDQLPFFRFSPSNHFIQPSSVTPLAVVVTISGVTWQALAPPALRYVP